MNRRRLLLRGGIAYAALPLVLLSCSTFSTGCRGKAAGPGGPPPAGVEFVTLRLLPIERTTEYIAALKSRRSTTLQPMVEGFVTAIHVKSGDRVASGAPILEIENSRQRASVASLESLLAARRADLDYARSEAERQRSLLEAGAASTKDAEQARTALQTAEAQLRAVEEQLAEQRVQLGYYRVTAPTAGVIGDVPVRVGDRVTTSSVLTTIDTGGGLELYIRVPVRRAGDLRQGLSVLVVDDEGALLQRTEVDFVSPQVDEATQTVLAKAPLRDGEGFRNEQQVRARIVWSEAPGLRMPVVAVVRIGGSHFAYVVDDDGSGAVARQRTVTLGPIVGNDYVVLDGLAEGERLIVGGVQKIRDGAPVDPRPATAEQG